MQLINFENQIAHIGPLFWPKWPSQESKQKSWDPAEKFFSFFPHWLFSIMQVINFENQNAHLGPLFWPKWPSQKRKQKTWDPINFFSPLVMFHHASHQFWEPNCPSRPSFLTKVAFSEEQRKIMRYSQGFFFTLVMFLKLRGKRNRFAALNLATTGCWALTPPQKKKKKKKWVCEGDFGKWF